MDNNKKRCPECHLWRPLDSEGNFKPHGCNSIVSGGVPIVLKPTTVLDAFQAIDEVVMSYHDGVSAERAMSNIAAIIADHESPEGQDARG